MSAGEPNPAATPTPCEDTQGDGRWMSMVCDFFFFKLFIGFIKYGVILFRLHRC